ncbi:MAG: GNAT family N-acetyltransferase [Rhodoferax sp.]
MKKSLRSTARKAWHSGLRKAFSLLPRPLRFAIFRSFVDCDPAPDQRLVLKIAETQEELEACFRLLHDAYVDSGFMKPDPSGMRVTIYHALPTTTTLCAKFDGEVVGTLSLIRESVFGFPLQAIFDLSKVREKRGKIAEVSALAVHPKFRKTGGAILFPLMKFMYEYCTAFFDTRHIVIAVNPNRIEMYESLLFFQRLTEQEVEKYDFANGAPAVGASLDLKDARATLKRAYGQKAQRKNLYHYFTKLKLPNIVIPGRRFYTTNDPVMTPPLLDYFFNKKTKGFAALESSEKALLYSIYNLPDYVKVLPIGFGDGDSAAAARQHQRYSFKCHGIFDVDVAGQHETFEITMVDCSMHGFLAHCKSPLPIQMWGNAVIRLGPQEQSTIRALAVGAKKDVGFYGFKLAEPDIVWRKFVATLEAGTTHDDMANATRFLQDR